MSIENLHTNWQWEGVSKVKAANRGFLKNAMENHFQVHASTLRGNIFVKGCVKYGRGRSVLVARLLQMQDGLCTFWTGSGGRNVVQMGDQEFRTSHPPVSLSLPRPLCVHVVIKCEEWTLSAIQSKFAPSFSHLKLVPIANIASCFNI